MNWDMNWEVQKIYKPTKFSGMQKHLEAQKKFTSEKRKRAALKFRSHLFIRMLHPLHIKSTMKQ